MANNKEKLSKTSNTGGLSFATVVLLIIVAVFIMWVLTGGENKTQTQKTINPDSLTPEVPTMPQMGY